MKCPHCGAKIERGYHSRAFVRVQRLKNGTFEYDALLPEAVASVGINRFQQIGFDTLAGVFVGATVGMVVELFVIPTDGRAMLTLSAIGGCAMFVWSIDELKVQFKRAIPSFVAWQQAAMDRRDNSPELVIRHNYTKLQAWYERPGALPVTTDIFDEFVKMALAGTPLVGKHFYPKAKGRLFSQREFEALAKLLKDNHIFHNKQLTRSGRLGFERYLKMRGIEHHGRVG